MTFYAGFTYLSSQTSASTTVKNYTTPSNYVSISPTSADLFISDNVYTPIFISANNSVLSSATNSYTGDYANYVIVNNSTNNWVLTLPLGPGGGTSTWRTGTFMLHIKKTGSGTLTIQTPADSAGVRVRGINTTSNKSYTLSNASAQSIALVYTSTLTDTGSTDTTLELWHVIS